MTHDNDADAFTSANSLETAAPRRTDAPLEEIYGVGSATAEKLDEAGYLTVYDVAGVDPETLAATVEDIGESQAADFVKAARSMVEYWPGESDD